MKKRFQVYEVINKIAKEMEAKSYLEIGVHKGGTFLNVEIQQKTAVDPLFDFDTEAHQGKNIVYCNTSSDSFFKSFVDLQKKPPYNQKDSNFKFDIIFIDGMHTYQQSYRDFLNSLPYSHDKTLWIFDDTLPYDPISAYPDMLISYKYRKLLNLSGNQWHGDVFKSIIAIHEFNKEFSYATHIDNGNPQTFVWKTSTKAKRNDLGGEDFIKTFTVIDLYENVHLLNTMKLESIYKLIGSVIDDDDMSRVSPNVYVRKLITENEKNYKTKIQKLEEENSVSAKIIEIDQDNKKILESLTQQKTSSQNSIDGESDLINTLKAQISLLKKQKDDLENARRNIVRHIKKAALKSTLALIACLVLTTAILKFF